MMGSRTNHDTHEVSSLHCSGIFSVCQFEQLICLAQRCDAKEG